MKSWDEFIKERQVAFLQSLNNWKKAQIACPKCGTEIERDDSKVLLTFPTRQEYRCPNPQCLWVGQA